MTAQAIDVVNSYFHAWQHNDMVAYRSLLDENASFTGPLAQCRGAEQCVEGMRGLASITTDLVIHKIFGDDADALTWFELCTSEAPPLAVVNWTHVDAGKITEIRVTFDPRSLLSDSSQ